MKKAILFFTMLLLSLNVSAVTMRSLFDVSIEVDSQASNERDKAITTAFEDLLVKVTGQPDVSKQESGKVLMKDAQRFVRSFRYASVKTDMVENLVVKWPDAQGQQAPVLEFKEEPEEESPKQRLIVSFDEKAVGEALWKSKLPVWGKTRPMTLIWVAFQDSEKRMLLDAEKKSQLQSLLNRQAYKRGVPLKYPKLDDVDQQNINVTDVWGSFREPVENASIRYGTEAVATVQLLLDRDNTWKASWSLYHGSEAEHWRLEGIEVKEVLEQGVDELAQRIAKRYVNIASVSNGDTLIYISDVNNVFDYNRVSQYLNGLTAVKKAELIQVHTNEVVFRLDLRSNEKQLKQSIELGKTLASHDPFGMENQDTRITYRLVP